MCFDYPSYYCRKALQEHGLSPDVLDILGQFIEATPSEIEVLKAAELEILCQWLRIVSFGIRFFCLHQNFFCLFFFPFLFASNDPLTLRVYLTGYN